MAQEYSPIFFVKENRVLKERFEDHFIIDWIVEDAYTNTLKGYFDNYKKSTMNDKTSFSNIKKSESNQFWNGLVFIDTNSRSSPKKTTNETQTGENIFKNNSYKKIITNSKRKEFDDDYEDLLTDEDGWRAPANIVRSKTSPFESIRQTVRRSKHLNNLDSRSNANYLTTKNNTKGQRNGIS